METKRPNYTETKAKSPGNPGNFPLGENKEGEYKGEMENMVKPSTLNQRCCSKSNEQTMKCNRIHCFKNSDCEHCNRKVINL